MLTVWLTQSSRIKLKVRFFYTQYPHPYSRGPTFLPTARSQRRGIATPSGSDTVGDKVRPRKRKWTSHFIRERLRRKALKEQASQTSGTQQCDDRQQEIEDIRSGKNEVALDAAASDIGWFKRVTNFLFRERNAQEKRVTEGTETLHDKGKTGAPSTKSGDKETQKKIVQFYMSTNPKHPRPTPSEVPERSDTKDVPLRDHGTLSTGQLREIASLRSHIAKLNRADIAGKQKPRVLAKLRRALIGVVKGSQQDDAVNPEHPSNSNAKNELNRDIKAGSLVRVVAGRDRTNERRNVEGLKRLSVGTLSEDMKNKSLTNEEDGPSRDIDVQSNKVLKHISKERANEREKVAAIAKYQSKGALKIPTKRVTKRSKYREDDGNVPRTINVKTPKVPRLIDNSSNIPISSKKNKTESFDIQSIDAESLTLVPIERAQKPVPRLAYGLERALFNPGVYHLQDPRSRVFNFDPYIQTIMPVNEFDFNALKKYITSSRDDTLLEVAVKEGRKYTGSTSSMTSALAHFHFLLSHWRAINPGNISREFPVDMDTFTALQRAPVAIFLKWKKGTYAIDADKEYDSANILSLLGKSMEKQLTLPKDHFEKYRKGNSHQISSDERNEPETYHYTTMGDFLMRSQLDAYDPRLPGTGTFDLKTRAVVSIRMDVGTWEERLGYEIRKQRGNFESYEREYYDMIRAAFLKYSLQVRMGRMDGIFVAFHNIERIFGFQYISLPEMDYALHGTEDTTLGDAEFRLSLDLLNRALNRATDRFPEKTLRIHFETRPTVTPFMYIFAEPMNEDQVQEIQNRKKEVIDEFERKIMGLRSETEDASVGADEEARRKAEWDRVKAMVEKSVERDAMEITEARAVVQGFIEENEILDLSDEEVRDEVEMLLSTFYQSEDGDDIGAESEAETGEGRINEQDIDMNETTAENATDGIEPQSTESDITTDAWESNGLSNEAYGEPTEAITDEVNIESANASSNAGEVDETTSTSTAGSTPIIAMILTIRNKVNGQYIVRPENLTSKDQWTIEYALAEVTDPLRANTLYGKCKTRRQKSAEYLKVKEDMGDTGQDGETAKMATKNTSYLRRLSRLAKQGRKWREEIDQKDREAGPTKVLFVGEEDGCRV